VVALVRVLLADDNGEVLAYLCERFGKEFEIIGAVQDGKQAVDTAFRLDPDVLVLDISMPVLNGFQVAARLRDMKCRTKIVVLTTYEGSDYISEAFSSGASAYVTKRHLATDLLTAIRSVLLGNTFISTSVEPPEVEGVIM
jgi:DNA-binding NarL/FixJ family response regulator